MNKPLINILDKFKDKKILVVGDIMLDKYIWGSVKRISPEAPVQVVNVEKENYVPGGAANVANNVTDLDAGAYIVGVAGEDSTKNLLLKNMEQRKISNEGIVIDPKRPTIQKVRILGQNQQLLRVDYEDDHESDNVIEESLIKNIKNILKKVDGIVVSDYGKGVITEEVMNVIKTVSAEEGKVIVVDPKPKHTLYYKDVDVVTPNQNEAIRMATLMGEIREDVDIIGKRLLKELNTTMLITQGEKGMGLFETEGKITHIPTKAKEVYDVTGAGDTVVAVLALSLCSGANIKEAAIIANHAAGIVVGKIGTSTLTVDEIRQSLENE